MAGRARGNPGPGGRELRSRGSSDQVTRRGDRRDNKNTAASAANTAADKPQPKQVKEAVQENKPEETAASQASVQVRRMMLHAAVQIICRMLHEPSVGCCHMTS